MKFKKFDKHNVIKRHYFEENANDKSYEARNFHVILTVLVQNGSLKILHLYSLMISITDRPDSRLIFFLIVIKYHPEKIIFCSYNIIIIKKSVLGV